MREERERTMVCGHRLEPRRRAHVLLQCCRCSALSAAHRLRAVGRTSGIPSTAQYIHHGQSRYGSPSTAHHSHPSYWHARCRTRESACRLPRSVSQAETMPQPPSPRRRACSGVAVRHLQEAYLEDGVARPLGAPVITSWQ